MAKKKKKTIGRPKKPSERVMGRYLQVRLQDAEHGDFVEAAELAGVPLSTWVRERLRIVARKELESYGKEASFLSRK